MEPVDENFPALPGNGGPHLPGDDQQKLGLGFDRDPEEEDEALYEKRLSEDFEGLVLGEHRSERDSLVDQGARFNGGKINKEYNGNISYPVRPDAEDCSYYIRNGSCKFGSSCKFNHPFKRRAQYSKPAKDKEGYSERPGQIECKYQMTSGGCKFGQACKYSHNRTKAPVPSATPVNFLGLPIRPGATECSFYMRNGSCKYGSSCKFNHPEPTATPGGNSPSGYVNGGTVSLPAVPRKALPQWSSPGASPGAINGNGYVLPVIYSPTPGVVPAPNLDWNSYQAPVYPATERRLPTPPAFTLSNPTETNFYSHQNLPMLVDDFPERPGEPECNYFIKTGDCKYRSACKFHHPKNRMKSTQCTFSDKGLPLRPDEKICSYYTRYGICKYGPSCRYDHPVNYDNSASSSGYQQNRTPFYGNSGAENGGKYDDNADMYQNG